MGTLIRLPEGPFDLHALLGCRGLGHGAKVSCTTNFEKAKNSLLKKKNIYPESGGSNMEMKMLRKHISCERLGSEIALNLLSEHKLMVS